MPSSIVCKPRPTTTTQTSAAPFWPPARARVTHLARKALPMRHKISSHHLNPLKKRSLKAGVYELHTRDKHASPGSADPGPHPGDASCGKTPPHASPNSVSPTQPTEKEGLKTRCLRTPLIGQRCVTRLRCLTGPQKPVSGRHMSPPVAVQPRESCFRPPTPGPRPLAPRGLQIAPPTLSHFSEIAYNDKGDYDP